MIYLQNIVFANEMSILDEIISTLIGVIVGAFIGFVASYMLWYLQENARKKNVRHAFQTELERLEPTINKIFILIMKIKPPKIINEYGDDENAEQNFNIYKELRVLKVYPDSGNWYNLKEEAYSLDPIISNGLDELYNNLIDAECFRKNFIDEDCINKNNIYAEPLTKCLENALTTLPKIKDLLRE